MICPGMLEIRLLCLMVVHVAHGSAVPDSAVLSGGLVSAHSGQACRCKGAELGIERRRISMNMPKNTDREVYRASAIIISGLMLGTMWL